MSNDKTHDGEEEGHSDSRASDYRELRVESTELVVVEGSTELAIAEERTELSVEETPEDLQSLPIPALQRMRNTRRYGRFALLVGVFARAVVTLCTTAEDSASIGDLFLTYTRFWQIFILILLGVFGLGAAAVTWGFWTPQVQDYTAVAVDGVRRCFGGAPTQMAEETCSNTPACLERVSTSVGWLGYVSASCSVATLGLVANENEEGTRMMLRLPSPTAFTAIFSLVLGVIATFYSAVTDLSSLWQVRPGAQGSAATRRPSTFIYIVIILGTLELFYRTWVLIYLTSLEQWDNRALGAFLSTVFTLSGSFVNFCFQSSYAIEGSPFLMRVKAFMVNLPLPLKIIVLAFIGLTTVVSNMSMTTFNMSTLLPAIFNERLGYSLSQGLFNVIAILTASGITFGDLLSSFTEVVRQMMGWDQPDNLFLRGVRSPPIRIGHTYWMNRHRVTLLPDDDEAPVALSQNRDDVPLVEQPLSSETRSNPGPYSHHDFAADYNF